MLSSERLSERLSPMVGDPINTNSEWHEASRPLTATPHKVADNLTLVELVKMTLSEAAESRENRRSLLFYGLHLVEKIGFQTTLARHPMIQVTR